MTSNIENRQNLTIFGSEQIETGSFVVILSLHFLNTHTRNDSINR